MKRHATPQDQSFIKYNNTKMVLDIIREDRQISRSEIARQTGMSPTSVTRIVTDLEELGLVRDTTIFSSGVGRRAIMLDICADVFYSVGIDIATDEIVMCLLNFAGEIIVRQSREIDCGKISTREIGEIIDNLYKKTIEMAQIKPEKITSTGISTFGTIDIEHGVVVFGPQFQWSNVPLGKIVSDRIGLPVFVDNDVKCGMIGEMSVRGANKIKDAVFLSIGRGVGSAIVNNGKLVRGTANSAGEIGHTIVEATDGKLCVCGRKGCLAAYVAENLLLQKAQRSNPNISTIAEIMKEYQNGAAWANDIVQCTSQYIAVAINNAVCFINPETIILGGKLINENDALFCMAIEKFKELTYEPLKERTIITRSVLQGSASCVGAALMAQSNYLKDFLKKQL